MRFPVEIVVREGDLTAQPDVDALVHPANTLLLLGAGLGGLIARKGGPAVHPAGRGPVALGDVVDTPGGGLAARYVLHAAVVGYRAEDLAAPRRQGALTSEAVVARATTNALALAEALGCVRVAVAPLGTGMGGLAPDECARAMLAAARDYAVARPRTRLAQLVVVCLLASEREAFERARDELGALPSPSGFDVGDDTTAHRVSLANAPPDDLDDQTEIRRSYVSLVPPATPPDSDPGTSDW